jgi:outer membrane lipoprotein-sorting protein
MRSADVLALLALVILGLAATPLLATGEPLDEILRQFDEVQLEIRTLSADFTETTESALLTDSIVAEGRVFMTKPDSVRWEYSSPEEMSFVINEDEYTGYFPLRKQAERRGIHRWREQLFRFLGLGQASEELAKFYDITLSEKNELSGTHLLVLTPKKKRVRKRMDPVHFWVDGSTFLPVRVEYRSSTGNHRVIEFSRMAVNPQLAIGLYDVEIPSDVEVTKGFSALSGFSSSN